MKKIIIFSTDVFTDLTEDDKVTFNKILNDITSRGDKVIFTARSNDKKKKLNGINIDNKTVYFYDRFSLKRIIKNNSGRENYFIVVGNKEADLFMAASSKLFYIVPKWCKVIQGKVNHYGVKIKSLDRLKKLIDIIKNQNSWFYRLDLDEKTTVLSLTSANTMGPGHSQEELDMIEGFKKYLKEGNKKYANVLLCHFLAGISNNPEFREIKDWSIMPSSGKALNQDMILFKEKARELMNGKKKDNIFIRHTATWKGHESRKNGGNRFPCDRHFDTIILNNKYKNKLKNRTVCVFDDYLTYGTTFETARNLLQKEGVKKIFFVSLGRFGKKYIKQDYMLDGDIFEKGYKYDLKVKEEKDGRFDENAITEIKNLYNIIFE
ncbi:hypothetical protein C3495_06005 [Clostridiaceae bacterium 14S0207]|nr:hypothetical protein C3495_06005 [Clostridiaceae bacterium 14S0207]